MAKIAQHMTRIVAIGKVKSYEYVTTPFKMGKGQLDIGGGQTANFALFNNDREGAQNQHTKAKDFSEMYKVGDKVFLTGSDNRNYNAEKDTYYESIQGWDFRSADDTEASRYVFVYVGDVESMEDGVLNLKFVNYKDEEILFPINISNVEIPDDIEEGARVKIKGELFNGLKMDFYGDGTFVTERNAATIEVLNSAEEIKADAEETPGEGDMWD